MGGRLSTGIKFLDQRIGGGLIPGTVVGLQTPPDSQGELLLKELACAHDTLYLSTTRTESDVRDWLATDGTDTSIRNIDVRHVRSGASDSPRAGDTLREVIESASGWTSAIDTNGHETGTDGDSSPIEPMRAVLDEFTQTCIVIDPINPLERGDDSEYMQFLHGFKDRLATAGSIAFLHMVETSMPPESRWLTLQMADEVWRVSMDMDHDQVNFRLSVTKSRSGDVPDRQIKLNMDDCVYIDTSRDIA